MQEEYNATIWNNGGNGLPTTILIYNQEGQDLDRVGIVAFRQQLCKTCPLHGDCDIRPGSQVVSSEFSIDEIKQRGQCFDSLVFPQTNPVQDGDTRKQNDAMRVDVRRRVLYASGLISVAGLFACMVLTSKVLPWQINQDHAYLLGSASLFIQAINNLILETSRMNLRDRIKFEKNLSTKESARMAKDMLGVKNQSILTATSFVLVGSILVNIFK